MIQYILSSHALLLFLGVVFLFLSTRLKSIIICIISSAVILYGVYNITMETVHQDNTINTFQEIFK